MRTKLALLIAAGILAGCKPQAPPPPPVAPPSWDIVDPEIAGLGRETLAIAEANPASVSARSELALVYHANGLTDLAATTYAQTIQLDPRNARHWYRLAIVQEKLGRRTEAFASIGRAAELDPTYAPIWWRHGYWLMEEGRIAEARDRFDVALNQDSTSVPARAGIARAHIQDREFQQAYQVLIALVNQDMLPDAASYLRHMLGTALQRLDRTVEARGELSMVMGTPPRWPDPWLDELAERRRGYKAKLEQINAALAGDASPGSAQAAVSLLERMLRTRRDDLVLMTTLATAHLNAGQPDRAIDVLRKAMRVNDRYVATHVNLSLAYEAKGDLSAAEHHADQAIEVAPMNAPAYRQRARLMVIQERWDDAIVAFARAIELGDIEPETGNSYGWSLARQRQWPEAENAFARIVANRPGYAEAWVGLALSRAELGRLDEAGAALTQAAALDRDVPNFQLTFDRIQQLRTGGGG